MTITIICVCINLSNDLSSLKYFLKKIKYFSKICIQNLAPHAKKHYLCTQKFHFNKKQSYNETFITQAQQLEAADVAYGTVRNGQQYGVGDDVQAN